MATVDLSDVKCSDRRRRKGPDSAPQRSRSGRPTREESLSALFHRPTYVGRELSTHRQFVSHPNFPVDQQWALRERRLCFNKNSLLLKCASNSDRTVTSFSHAAVGACTIIRARRAQAVVQRNSQTTEAQWR